MQYLEDGFSKPYVNNYFKKMKELIKDNYSKQCHGGISM